MRTVGQILKEEREASFYSLEEIEKATKIRKELLEALEADDYSNLPPATFVQGFIKNYAKFLKVDPEKLLAVFRREFQEKGDLVMEAFSNPTQPKRFTLTPSKVIGTVVTLVILSFFAYLWVQYHSFVGAPMLEVSQPQDQQVLDEGEVVVVGKTDPEAILTINNQKIALSDKGEFRENVKLIAASNRIVVVATSKFGQKSEVNRTVYLKR